MKSIGTIYLMTFALFFALTLNAQKALEVGYGHLSARALHAACYFKLFDLLADGPKNAEQLAASRNLQSGPVKSLMRVVANHDLVNMDESGRFSLNENSKALLSTANGSLQPAFAKEYDQKRWQAIGNLQIPLQKGEPAFKGLFGKSFYAYLESDEKAASLFNSGMKAFSDAEDQQVANHFPFWKFSSYCDIGGGTGGLVNKILSVAPTIEATLFELPAALEGLKLDGVKLKGGSFFDGVPHAELYTLKRVLHNWEDADALKILKNAKKGVINRAKGRILVIEKVMPKTIDHSLLVDSEIIGLSLGGQERTLDEFVALGNKANLQLEKHIPLDRVSILVFKLKA